MNILQVVDLQHKYLHDEITWQELPNDEQVGHAKEDYNELIEALKEAKDQIRSFTDGVSSDYPHYIDAALNAVKDGE